MAVRMVITPASPLQQPTRCTTLPRSPPCLGWSTARPARRRPRPALLCRPAPALLRCPARAPHRLPAPARPRLQAPAFPRLPAQARRFRLARLYLPLCLRRRQSLSRCCCPLALYITLLPGLILSLPFSWLTPSCLRVHVLPLAAAFCNHLLPLRRLACPALTFSCTVLMAAPRFLTAFISQMARARMGRCMPTALVGTSHNMMVSSLFHTGSLETRRFLPVT